MRIKDQNFSKTAKDLFLLLILLALYLTSFYSFLLFHTLIELFSIVIAGAIFILAWTFRRFYKDSFLIFIGTAFLFCSLIDLVHALTYKGMSILPGYDANLPTQLWVAARYLQSISLLAAPLFLKRKVNPGWLVGGFILVTGLLLLSIFAWNIFPICYIEGVGLTPFKIASEYVIDIVLVTAVLHLLSRRRMMDRKVLLWMVLSIGLTMVSELAFTFYIDVYGLSNMIGHFCRIIAYFLVYKATVETEAGAIFTDMTQLRETESALRASEDGAQRSLAELLSVYAHTPVGLCFFDTSLRYQAINDMLAGINHRPASEHIGKSLNEVLPADFCLPIEQALRRTLETGQPVLNQELSGSLNSSTGQMWYWLVSYHPVYGKDGALLGVSCVVQDVTEHRGAEEQLARAHRSLQDTAEKLERSNQELEQFAFVASHDLQEPLRKIKMFGNLLQQQVLNSAPDDKMGGAGDYLRRMQNAAERMQTMIDGLLELSRVNTRSGDLALTQLKQIAEEAVNDLEAQIQATSGRVVVGELYSAEVDGMQIRRLFQNLIGNALKFHKKDTAPLIEIDAQFTRSPGSANIILTVKDNGIGFEEQYAQRIFQPFQRLHGRGEYEGTGLGLSICQKIVERHHGKIEAHSRPGEGARFTITLPIEQPDK